MIDVLRQHLLSRLGDDVDQLDLVLSCFETVNVKRNGMVLSEGTVCRNVYFIAKGCLQVFAYDAAGNETTREIAVEDQWCSDLISFGGEKPATENIRAIEPTVLLAIDRRGFGEMMARVPQFDKVYRQILEASYANSVYRINSFVALSALDRIKWLMEHRPYLMMRVSGRLVASYLGINKDVFSRLRAQL